jgi:phosphocarrier protein
VISREVRIINKLGLHARAAAQFVTTASGYQSDIQLTLNERRVDGKSIMDIMMLAASQGTTLTLSADGKDAASAVDALSELVKARFGEEE